MKELIEYCHIYEDEELSPMHLKSLSVAKKLETNLKQEGIEPIKVILVDDYNPEERILDYSYFHEELKRNKMFPDAFLLESGFVPYSYYFLQQIKWKERKKIIRYINKSKKIPCSVLAAIWYIFALGGFEDKLYGPIFSKGKFEKVSKINIILPKDFEKIEKRALKNIENFGRSDLLKKINHVFF
jgi:hypothetical protein